ncbi:protein phosphatase [Streptomyces eurocidicus]|uniref:Protein phosphatase n=1 Tax=Streptomyces eurocidicus TaxID=66423 RepID=A0A2N8NTS2_STREU|nr:SpoIIE family protein phosphatase [Streptomyces eurocidicus]MBB5119395.1 serine phosphatase RsbU (regulator of sigma subunit)/anti-sigma regulatory factor (Ser/Thr protein kinase) [Streptomyces eurocidicus]MBF6053026.1 SpoIIE family protein phosphatase [Streptomyces eurocidicus]PNE32157.1 protein phosphatase [Streptomyces eurocidicus]
MGLVAEDIGPALARERFLGGGSAEGAVRSPILSSWQRCRALGLSPDGCELPYTRELDLEGPLVRAAGPVMDRLEAMFAGRKMNICLADEHGAVLQRRFGDAAMARRLAPIQSVPGFVFAERYGGTNGIGLALAERRLVGIYGAEHFAERSQTNACSAIPVRDLLNGRIEGVLCFGFPYTDADGALDAVIRRAAGVIERRLLEQSSARERALLRAYLDVRSRAPAGVPADGASGVAVGGTGGGRPDDLGASGLDWRDQMILKEKATELISSAQRAAVEVSLPGGRRVTLLSRPVTSSTGVEGVAVEALLPSLRQPLAVPTGTDAAAGLPARQDFLTGVPGAPGVPAPPPAAPSITAPDAATSGLVLVGEPGVGKYAVAARRRLELLSEASTRIGTTLDVGRTARELAETAVPRLADYVTIDLPEAVLRGDEPTDPCKDLRRTVVHGIREDCPFYPEGERVGLKPATPQLRCLTGGETVLEPDLRSATGWISQDPERARRLLAHDLHSLITVPLLARGIVLGIASFYRARDPAPFGDDDRSLARELTTRAAICVDNARRYTREHSMVLALQHSLLPHGFPDQNAVEVAHRYMPAESGVGGDWFDVIPLSGTRVALVVGDVVGHGLHAAATMGRLRTAARNFAELDLPPDEVLTHLDNLVGRLDREECGDDPAAGNTGIIGATCLYAIYDPTSQRCAMARAGHPPPALVRPDGTVTFPDLPAGPPLGLGGLPFETAEFPLAEGSQLVLYTDGLIEDRHRDFDTALEQLRRALAHPNRPPEETCRAVVRAVVPDHPADDIALLVARTHALSPQRIATWELPADPALVSTVRGSVTRRLADWGLEEVGFAAELLLSELVTNAIRYGTGPIGVRLLYDRTLTCEVSDTSSTAPHLRHAATTDEGGRGLFLVAQLAQSWGTRYTADGKVIWAEFALDVPGGRPGAAAPPLAGLSLDDIPAI